MTFATRWIDRIDAGDRGLLDRWAIPVDGRRGVRWSWIGITHAGGAFATIGAVLFPPLFRTWPRSVSWHAGIALAVSHFAVQLVKRRICRARPSVIAVIRCPDRFSFPSGHATAALAVAASYAVACPAAGIPLVSFAVLVGWSRVVLRVHYPGDVLIGQLIALVTVGAVSGLAPY